MKKLLVAVAAVAFLGACSDEPLTPVGDAVYSHGGGNPHFLVQHTSCGLYDGDARCSFKAVGLGGGNTLHTFLDVDATVQVSCRNPGNGNIVQGWNGRTRVGSGAGTHTATRNGQVTDVIVAEIDYQGPPNACPTGLVFDSADLSDLSWVLKGNVNNVHDLNTISGSLYFGGELKLHRSVG